MKLDKIILFGAGGEAIKIIDMLTAIDCKIQFIVDNDISKVGSTLNNIDIFSVSKILETDVYIYITPLYDSDIIDQLDKMGVGNRIIKKIDFFDYYLDKLSLAVIPKDFDIKVDNEKTLLFDDMEGIGWGGIEQWNKRLISQIEGKIDSVLTVNRLGISNNSKNELNCNFANLSFLETIKILFTQISRKLPIAIINNWTWHVMIVACLLKKKFPQYIKIISTIHSDEFWRMKKVSLYEKYFDHILCVSKEIFDKMINEYNIDKDKIVYRYNFVDYDETFLKEVSTNNFIKIGYAGRLEKFQKRADLILNLIDILNTSDINYLFEIAGDGEYYNIINEFIDNNNLKNKVKLKGLLSENEMKYFWRDKDISINLSDFEGMSLSMIESMSYGAVPIVTKVSGVYDIIEDGYNGYFIEQNNLEAVVEIVHEFIKDSGKLKYMSDNCRKTIIQKCNRKEYVNYILKIAFGD